MNIKIKSQAKINLFLDIVSRREDGYHCIDTVYQLIDLHDILEFEKSNNGIEIICDNENVPTDSSNIVHKAIAETFKLKNISGQGVRIKIKKNIPIGAGLSGGSSNAAAAIIAADRLFKLKLTPYEKLSAARTVGMDVAFHLYGGRCTGTNRGEEVTQIKNNLLNFVIINTGLNISTKWAYGMIRLDQAQSHSSLNRFVETLNKGSIKEIGSSLFNTFEQFVFPHHPLLKTIKQELRDKGAVGTLMSGSGSTIYGLFETMEEANNAELNLKDKHKLVISAQSSDEYEWAEEMKTIK